MGAVVLFDGVCNFCDASVNFVIDHDRAGYFKFAPLQSEAGMNLAAEYGLESKVANVEGDNGSIPIDSVILIEDDKAYTHSTAALRIARHVPVTVLRQLYSELVWINGVSEHRYLHD